MTDQTGTTTRAGQISRPDIRQTGLLSQSVAIARRNFIHIKRMPEMLLDVTIQPVMFVLLFAFVFGSSIDIPIEGGYEAFLLPGIMAQTVAFSAFIVAVGLTADLDKGIVDRMRSLPINPAAVLVGRSFSSVAHSSIGLVVMSLTGLTIGWGIHTDVLRAALGYLLLVGWAFAMIWIGIWVGSAMRSVEAVNGVMFATMFPITFLANTFAPTNTMPDWLRTVAEWNPISSLTQAVRELWGNDMPLHADAELPLRYPIVFTIGWIVVITAVVAPLAIGTFRARTSD